MTDTTVTLSPSYDTNVRLVAPGQEGPELDDSRPNHVLIGIHGIRDTSAWCGQLKIAIGRLSNTNVDVKCVRYSRVSSFSFLFGRRSTRNRVQASVLSQIDAILLANPDKPISFLCHSNGTKIISEIVDRLSVRPEWIFLCGSVCKLDDVSNLSQAKQGVVSDVGLKDLWPVFAEAIRPSFFEATGAIGFFREPIIDRMFSHGHGGGTVAAHIEQWILPTISTGRVNSTNIHDLKYKKHISIYLRRFMFLFISFVTIIVFIILFKLMLAQSSVAL